MSRRGGNGFKFPLACFFVLAFLAAPALPLSADEGDKDHEESALEEVSEGLGVAVLWGLIVLNAAYYYSMAYRRWPRESRQRWPEIREKPLQWKGRFRNYHYWGNPAMTVLGALHGIWAKHGGILLWRGWALMICLCLSGHVMKTQGADQPGAKASRWLHAQHILAVTMAVFPLVGHALVED